MGPTTFTKRAWRSASIVTATALAATTMGALPAFADESHRVSVGETVSGIALRYGSSVNSIVKANGLNSRALIIAGQTLTVPTGSATTASKKSAAPAKASSAHKVAPGDTVWDLARRYGTNVSTIIQANGLNSRATIRIGQSLTIPGAGGAKTVSNTVSSKAAPSKNSPATSASGVHKVANGDTVWDLARRYSTSVSTIVKANGLNSRATIRIGQSLTIPGAKAVGSTPAAGSDSKSAPAAGSGGAPNLATGDNLDQFGGVAQNYTVTSGDTLAAIARKFGLSVQAIASANSIKNPALIRIGQVLAIPGGVPTGLVGDSFAGRTYDKPVVGAANQNKATLNAMEVPSRAAMQALVIATAKDYGVNPALAQAVAYQESGFNMRAVSPANAIGTMQVIPATGAWMSDVVGRELNLLVPEDNVTAGVALLRHLQRDGRALETAIAGYYQGETGVRKYGMYADTKRYVANVLALMNHYS